VAADPGFSFDVRDYADRRTVFHKVVFAIQDFFPQFTCATFPNHGQTVV
jgi:hypothetical protein